LRITSLAVLLGCDIYKMGLVPVTVTVHVSSQYACEAGPASGAAPGARSSGRAGRINRRAVLPCT